MKKTKILYWVFTGLFGGFMLFSAIPDLMVAPEAITLITDTLGYPKYFILYLGIAKVLGVIAILVPGFPRIKEWAYAGLFFDLISATYSQLAVMGFFTQIFFMLPPIIIGILSYIFYHKKRKEEQKQII
jgi:hypothetical protein